MIYSVRGKLIHAEPGFAVIECGGVGYRCFVSLSTLQRLPPLGGEASLFTCLIPREESLDLFGFADQAEQQCFKMLTSVSGVGPKVAMSILSDLTPDRFALAVASGDAKTLTKSQGVGMKLAQRITLELKDKISGIQPKISDSVPLSAVSSADDRTSRGEAVSALTVLGYSQSEAALAVASCDPSLTVEEIIKAALKSLASRR